MSQLSQMHFHYRLPLTILTFCHHFIFFYNEIGNIKIITQPIQQTCHSPQRTRKDSSKNTSPYRKRMAIHRCTAISWMAALRHPPSWTTHFVVPSSTWDWSSNWGGRSRIEENCIGGVQGTIRIEGKLSYYTHTKLVAHMLLEVKGWSDVMVLLWLLTQCVIAGVCHCDHLQFWDLCRNNHWHYMKI